MTASEWHSLVGRLNGASKVKEANLRQSQLKRMTDELAGVTFTPAISERSRELAAAQKSLPERAAALMRKKKARLDQIRQERAQKELADATFTPKINDYKPPVQQTAGTIQRRVGHLLQYVSCLVYQSSSTLSLPRTHGLERSFVAEHPRTHTHLTPPPPPPSDRSGDGPSCSRRPAPGASR